MSDLVNISDFSYSSGLDLGRNNQSFTYLYGLSDFWQYLFQDTASNNLLLETTSVQASDIYSKFLQLCAGISIEDIGPSASSQLRLEIISNALNLPTGIHILSGSWTNNFTTIKVDNSENFFVGDTIVVSGVVDTVIYDVGNGINVQPYAIGGDAYPLSGAAWNGTFIITNVTFDGYITYYQPTDPGRYTRGGVVSTTSIGVETYQLSEGISTTRFIANRAFLPTIVLEENVDYRVDPNTLRISFAKPLDSYGFPSRLTSTGATEYSLWFVDVTYDEDLIYSQYPLLLGRTMPPNSNEAYRGFLYGLYYVYTSGPSLTVMEKGINLVLGIPLARNDETVLEVRPYLNTNQFIVITDMNSYIVPAGLQPTVSAGGTLSVGDELSKWVEIKDYESDGEWWLTYTTEIPPELMPILPPGLSRIIGLPNFFPGYDAGDGINENPINDEGISNPYTIDNYADWIMKNYLRYNTFLVKVNVTQPEFTSAQLWESVPELIFNLKPTHTFPLYSFNSGYNLALSRVIASTIISSFGAVSSVVGLTGISSTSSTGTITGGHQLSGNTITSAVGLLQNLDKVLSGITITGNVQSVLTSTLLSGVVSSTSVGSVGIQNVLQAAYTISSVGDISGGSDTTPVSSSSNITATEPGISVDITGTSLAIFPTEFSPYPPHALDGTWSLDGTVTLGIVDEVVVGVDILSVTGTFTDGNVLPNLPGSGGIDAVITHITTINLAQSITTSISGVNTTSSTGTIVAGQTITGVNATDSTGILLGSWPTQGSLARLTPATVATGNGPQ